MFAGKKWPSVLVCYNAEFLISSSQKQNRLMTYCSFGFSGHSMHLTRLSDLIPLISSDLIYSNLILQVYSQNADLTWPLPALAESSFLCHLVVVLWESQNQHSEDFRFLQSVLQAEWKTIDLVGYGRFFLASKHRFFLSKTKILVCKISSVCWMSIKRNQITFFM